eukprot:Hpha_TRINITY_DN16466_c0_g3::TRINITY_DN16466_c0_g3_i1::g.159226::m.159226
MQPDPQASPVLMLRSVPPGATEKDLENWAGQYDFPITGQKTKAVKVLLLTDRNLGFVQMQSIDEARYLMQLYQTQPHLICMHRAEGQADLLNLLYSNKPEIRANGKPKNQVPSSNTRILLVVLKDLSATIMMDDLFWVFSQFGVVDKLSSFSKNCRNQVLVQYQNTQQASLAMAYLNGREMQFRTRQQQQVPIGTDLTSETIGKCCFAIVPSKLQELTFKNQDQKNRDYEQVNKEIRFLFLQARQHGGNLKYLLTEKGEKNMWHIRDFLWGVWVLGEGLLDPEQDRAYVGQIPVDPAAGSKGIPEGQIGECVYISNLPPVPGGDSPADPPAADLDDHQQPPPEGFSARMLWRVLGMFGEIVAVKLLFKYQGCAIVQFKSKEAASDVIANLHNMRAYGKQWEVKESKNANATHWSGANTELQKRMCTVTDEGVFPPARPEKYNMFRPNPDLVLTDLDEDSRVTEQSIKDHFVQLMGPRGPEAVDLQDGRATMSFKTTEDALLAVAMCNGEDIALGEKMIKLRMHFNRPRGARQGGPQQDLGGLQPVGESHGDESEKIVGAKTPGAGLQRHKTDGEPDAGGFMGTTWTC